MVRLISKCPAPSVQEQMKDGTEALRRHLNAALPWPAAALQLLLRLAVVFVSRLSHSSTCLDLSASSSTFNFSSSAVILPSLLRSWLLNISLMMTSGS